MGLKSVLTCGLISLTLPCWSWAKEPTRPKKPAREGKEGHDRPAAVQEQRGKVNKQFDQDGSGKLDGSELEAAKAALKNRQGDLRDVKQRAHEVLKQFDANGDGKLDPNESQTARRAWQEQEHSPPGNSEKNGSERVLDRFDQNGNGKLEATEIDAAKSAWREKQHREQRQQQQSENEQPQDPSTSDRNVIKHARADRNDDGKVSPVERAKAEKIRRQSKDNSDRPNPSTEGSLEHPSRKEPLKRDANKPALPKNRDGASLSPSLNRKVDSHLEADRSSDHRPAPNGTSLKAKQDQVRSHGAASQGGGTGANRGGKAAGRKR